MRKIVLLLILAVVISAIYFLVRKSIPFSDQRDLLHTTISIDSTWQLGPAAVIYDKSDRQYYWMKSYTDPQLKMLDTLKSKQVKITYLKYLMGPLENRIIHMEIDSVVVFDQVVERN